MITTYKERKIMLTFFSLVAYHTCSALNDNTSVGAEGASSLFVSCCLVTVLVGVVCDAALFPRRVGVACRFDFL